LRIVAAGFVDTPLSASLLGAQLERENAREERAFYEGSTERMDGLIVSKVEQAPGRNEKVVRRPIVASMICYPLQAAGG
jgi:hypothetical protein